jgi:hypothetical protein
MKFCLACKNPSSNPVQTAWLPVKYQELVRVFKEASRNFKSTFRDIEEANKFKNHRLLYRKY